MAYRPVYHKPRRPVIELERLGPADGYSVIFDEHQNAKAPSSYFSEATYFTELSTARPGPKRTRLINSANLVSYILLFLAILSTVATIVIFTLTQHRAGVSKMYELYPHSLPILKEACDSRTLQIQNLIAHFLVNCVGTVILGMSNYIQQLCSSPTEEDISRGFRARGDTRFGANSPSSIFEMSCKNLRLIWISLLLTSLPLHLMLNGITGFAAKAVPAEISAIPISLVGQLSATQLSWTNTTANDCAHLLLSSRAHVTNFANLTIVLKDGLPPDAISYYNGSGESYFAQASDIVNCYGNMIASECQLTIRWFPLMCATVAIVTKAAIVFLVIRLHPHFKKVQYITVGDMIALASRRPELRRNLSDAGPPRGAIFEGTYQRQRIPWRRALGRWDVVIAIFWWTTVISVTAIGIDAWYNVVGGLDLPDRIKRFGLGTDDPATTLVSGATGQPFQQGPPFPVQVLVANSPQVWLSIGYLTWNNQIGRIWLEREWRSYYCARQLPRVSYGSQARGVRNARWLQLPYWLTASIMSISVFLHWFVSQTLFVVEIYFSDPHIASVFHMHYSPLAIIAAGSVSTVLVLGITVYYFIPVICWMPLMAGSAKVVFNSCSLLPASELPRNGIAWGDISLRNERLAGFGQVVGKMVEGVRYPGLISAETTLLNDYPDISDFDTAPLVKNRAYY